MKTSILMTAFILSTVSWAQDVPSVTVEPEETIEAAASVETPEAPTETAPVAPAESQAKVLDFEAEVIEGERKTPQLFLQMDVGTPTIDTLLYRRTNFQDFQSNDAKRKPKFRGTAQ